MNLVLIICMIISFSVVYYLTPWSIRYLRRIDLVVKDQHKEGKPLVPISGGMTVLAGLFIGFMSFIFFNTFFPNGGDLYLNNQVLMFLLSGLIAIMMISFVGFIDDLFIRGDKETSSGLRQWQKPLLTLAAAIPLMVVNSGVSKIALPYFGIVDTGLLYPLILIPIGVVGAANMVNMLAGFNGLETGMGIVYTGMLGLYSYFSREGIYYSERTATAVFAFIVFSALVAFYFFNRTPAKILPGDSLTYLLGGTIAVIAIIGNLERAALIISIPFLFEFIFKLRGKFEKQSYGYYENGKVKSFYDKIYSLPHILTRTGKFTEKQVVYTFILVELFFSSLIWII
ncbi:MAG: hypothetical protein AABX49_02890 [Nanoarchaeota archaeon]